MNFPSDRAAECADSYEQMAYVAAFTISSYSTTAARTGKPFNPLLGETFECDRTDDLGWRAISEQVSHHPPMLAQHCEGQKWRCWQEFTMASKFRGKYLQVRRLLIYHLSFFLTYKYIFANCSCPCINKSLTNCLPLTYVSGKVFKKFNNPPSLLPIWHSFSGNVFIVFLRAKFLSTGNSSGYRSFRIRQRPAALHMA